MPSTNQLSKNNLTNQFWLISSAERNEIELMELHFVSTRESVSQVGSVKVYSGEARSKGGDGMNFKILSQHRSG